jgi:hypothetical protein
VAAPRLEVVYCDYQNQGVEVMSVGYLESITVCTAWKNLYGLTYPVLSDPDSVVTVTYVPEQGGVAYFPHIVIIDEDQIVQYTVSNSFNEPQIRTFLNGMMEPVMSVTPNSLDFGSVMQGRACSRTVWVDNIGTGIVQVTSVTALDPDFTITPMSGEVYAYNDLMELTVTFAPTHLGEYSDSLLITSNGGDAVVALSGTGVELIITDLLISKIYNHAVLSWTAIPAASRYNIYSCSEPNVDPIPDNFRGNTTNSTYLDFNAFAPDGPDARFYCITAVFNE